MKLWALLKDSYREARDRKIFLVMLILSGILTLFIFSISFRMISAQEELESATRQMTYWMHFNPHLGSPTYSIENFEQTNDATVPWQADYRFDWVVNVNDADKLKQLPFTTRWQVRSQLMRDSMDYLDNVEVSSNVSKDPKQVRFTVTSHGTRVSDAAGWRYEPSILFAIPLPIFHTSVRDAVYFIEDKLVNGIGAWVAVLIGVVITASFIPNLLQKGGVEIMVSKPLHRAALLLYKYLGGLIFVFLLTAFTVLGVWAALGIRSGIWAPQFLLVIPAVTFYFALLYSVSTLAAVLTRSTIVAILLTVAFWFVLWLNGTVHSTLDGFRKARDKAETMVKDAGVPKAPAKDKNDDDEPPPEERREPPTPPDIPRWAYLTSDTFYKVLPRTRDMGDLTGEWVARGVLSEHEIKSKGLDNPDRPNWVETVGVTAAFIAVMLGLACWKFARTDY